VLELRRVAKSYPAGGGETVTVLEEVSLAVAAGQLAALYGPSGSGKSTLLNIIATVVAPDAGSVHVEGRDLAALTDSEISDYRKQYLGYVNQSLDLIPGVSAIENAALKLIGVCPPREARQRVEPLLERLGLAGRLKHRPDQLSAGERQRVLLARALATDPKLILADEPTGNLDRERSHEVLTLLTDLCHEHNVALLLVTHDPAAAAFADSVHELRSGRVVPYLPDRDAMALSEGR
jgi:putative ABC transport system ATP-binding protein